MRLEPVSASTHVDRFWRQANSFAFAKQDSACHLAVDELARVMLSLPIAFLPSGESFSLVALQGLDANRNLLVDDRGRWLSSYIPAVYRGYPFSLLSVEGGNLALHFDSESLDIELNQPLQPFFDSSGQLAPKVNDILNFLVQVSKGRAQSQVICDLLRAHNLIHPWDISIRLNEESIAVKGLYCVDEDSFLSLPGPVLEELNKLGAISVVYSQLLSMQHLGTLERVFVSSRTQPTKPVAPNLDLGFFANSGNIDLSNL